MKRACKLLNVIANILPTVLFSFLDSLILDLIFHFEMVASITFKWCVILLLLALSVYKGSYHSAIIVNYHFYVFFLKKHQGG